MEFAPANNYYTTVEQFDHGRLPYSVTLVGVCHTATPGYYEQVQAEIGQRESAGAAVHVERMNSNFAPEDLVDQELGTVLKLMFLGGSAASLMGLIDDLGLEKQTTEIDYKDTWLDADADIFASSSLLRPRQVSALFAENKALQLAYKWRSRARRAEMFIKFMEEIDVKHQHERAGIPLDTLKQKFLTKFDLLYNAAMIDFRNDYAVVTALDALEQTPEQPIVMFWGQGHIHGIGKTLTSMGFAHTDTDRLKAVDYSWLRERNA